MNKKFFLTAAIIFLSSLSITSMAENKIVPKDPHVNIMGRTDVNSDGSVRFGYPGVSLFVEVDATHLNIEAQSSSNQSYLEILIDNKESQIVKLSTELQSYPIFSEKKSVKHKIAVVHRSETWHGIVTIKSFIADGKFLSAPQLPKRKILVLGDSVTCGEAIERVAGAKKETSWWNPSLSYGMLTAKALNAQVQLVCMGGHGLVRTWDGKTNELNLPDFYPLTLAYPNGPTWNQTNYDPDVIVSAIGTNDFSQGIPDRENYVTTYEKFLLQVLSDHKHAQIFLTEGSILSGDRKSAMTDYLKEIIKRTDDKISNNRRLHYAPATYYPGDATDGHPTKEQHSAMAKDLIPVIKSVTQW